MSHISNCFFPQMLAAYLFACIWSRTAPSLHFPRKEESWLLSQNSVSQNESDHKDRRGPRHKTSLCRGFEEEVSSCILPLWSFCQDASTISLSPAQISEEIEFTPCWLIKWIFAFWGKEWNYVINNKEYDPKKSSLQLYRETLERYCKQMEK